MIHKHDFYRPLKDEDIAQINEVIHDLSDSEKYIRPIELEKGLKFPIMNGGSSDAFMNRFNNDPDHVIIKEMLNQSPANKETKIVANYTKFLPTWRLGKLRGKVESEAKSQGFNKNKGNYRIGGIAIGHLPVFENTYSPREFNDTANRYGATEIHETPPEIIVGWLNLVTDIKEMKERRELIISSLVTKIGVISLGPIELGTI